MKRRWTGDAFRPRGQPRAEIDLAEADPEAVVEALGPRLGSERRARIDAVVDRRVRRISIAVEGVHDPHNTAAIVRTAEAFGVQEVHVVKGAARFACSRKVTQGAHKWVDVFAWDGPAGFAREMRARGGRVLVADAEGDADVRRLGEIAEPVALVFGNESEGVGEEMRALADGSFRLPMWGFSDSFNVSVAAAVALAHLRGDGPGDLDPRSAAVLRARFYLRAVRGGLEIALRELESKKQEQIRR